MHAGLSLDINKKERERENGGGRVQRRRLFDKLEVNNMPMRMNKVAQSFTQNITTHIKKSAEG